MPFIDDFSLLGFWPLNEPSGSPIFHNYTSAEIDGPNNGRAIGIPNHMHVNTTNGDTVEPRSFFPHSEIVYEPTSGTFQQAFRCYGTYDRSPNDDGPFEKVLIVGRASPREGLRGTRLGVSCPQVANSGFTVGGWVLPRTNGWTDLATLNAPRTESSPAHALISQGVVTQGFAIGVSGFLQNDARGSEFVEGGGNRQLRAYAHLFGSTDATSVLLDTPIESGCFTHVTVSYKFVNTSLNEWVLYKNGRVAGSGTSTFELTDLSTTFADTPLTVGGMAQSASNRIEWATGFGNMISGVYAFRRTLHEGEILDLHNHGGMQPSESSFRIPEGKEILISDPDIIGYYPFVNPGFADAGPNHWPFIALQDEGQTGQFIECTGPFGRGGVSNDVASSPTIALVSGSGTLDAFAAAANTDGFTIAFWIDPDGTTTYQNNIFCSIGGAGSTTITPSLNGHYAGFLIVADDAAGANTVKTKVVIFNGGNPNDQIILEEVGTDQIQHTLHHVAFLYSAADDGISLYIDGILQSSGTAPSLNENITRLAGSGLPLCFLGGVDEDNPEILITNGGQNSCISDILIMSRPLRGDELAFISQSGIDLSKNYYTPNDPRLRCYWPANNLLSSNPIIVRDQAKIWERVPMPLTRAETDYKWTEVLTSNNGQFIKTDLFGEDRRPIPEVLTSYGNLGITSGVWVANGGSLGIQTFSAEIDRKNSLGALGLRYRPGVSPRNSNNPAFNDEYILSFEITPSGNIPASDWPDNKEFNSVIFSYSSSLTSLTAREQFLAYITSINANNPDPLGFDAGYGPSGVSIVFAGIDGNPSTVGNANPLVSGNLIYGIPNRVLFHSKSLEPHTFTETTGNGRIQCDLYINGQIVNTREETTNLAKIWSDSNPGSTNDDFILEWGGYAVARSFTAHTTDVDTGLGDNYLREMYIAKGQFSKHDLLFFSQSGIARSTTLPNFSDQQATSIVRTNDLRLKGYYRFTGGSGTLDLSDKANDLSNLAEEAINNGVSIDANSSAYNMRWLPGPLKYSRLADSIGVVRGHASGISFLGNVPSLDANAIPVFAVSGVDFNTPDQGFSIGFWYTTRADISLTNDLGLIISFGITPTNATISSDIDASWAILQDDAENIKLVLSKDGSMYVDPVANAAHTNTTECGIFSSTMPTYNDSVMIEKTRLGFFSPGPLDSWKHIAWTFDAVNGIVKCFLNGQIVDIRSFSTDGVVDTLNIPTDDTNKIITFLGGISAPWNWETLTLDNNGVLTDVFYFDEPLSDAEILYIAENGIAESDTPLSSGIIGGYTFGSDTGSGILASWLQGLDTGSGFIGSWAEGAFLGSGIIGSFVEGLVVPSLSGFPGGYINARGGLSGLIGSYLRGSNLSSGLLGGFVFATGFGSGFVGGRITGGLSGAVEFDSYFIVEAITATDFDAMIHLLKTSSSDFDAKVQVFRSECPPEVSIILPDATVSGQAPPFNQYFIGFASGVQGKTISSTRWSFGDFTGMLAGSESGSNPGYYPIQHYFSDIGFYIVKFEATDSDGLVGSATRFVHAASGIDPVRIALSGVPQIGEAALTVDFIQTIETIPADVIITSSLLDNGLGQTTTINNPTVVYTEPGIYKPVWCIKDSRGYIFCDSLEPGIDQDKAQNESGL